jgi:hypothetical protein
MSLALIRKELREHGLILLVSGLLSMVSLLGFVVMGEESGGRFTSLRAFALSIGLLNALIAANRLIVREYAGRTQLFLEVLPIGRARVFATKWLLGALWMQLLIAAAWASVLRYQRKTEVIATADALHVLGAASLFVLTVWAFAAMAGMLGRHRYTVWIAMLFILGIAVDAGNLSPDDLPVLSLLNDRIAMARGAVHPRDALWAGALTLAFLGGAAALALIGSGAIASTLARRMTARERVFLLVAALAAGFVYSVVEGKRKKPAFEVVDAAYVQGKHARIGVMATEDMARDRMLALGEAIASDVDLAIDALGLARYGPSGAKVRPAIYVMPQQGLDKRLIERAALSGTSGIVLRASPEVPPEALRSEVLHALVNDASLGRAGREDRHVLLDGYAERTALRDDPRARALSELRFASLAQPVDARQLVRWEASMEQLGECRANALALATVDALAAELGEAKLAALLRALFGRPHDDVRVLLEASPSEQLEQAGSSWSAVAARVEAQRVRSREQRAGELQHIPARAARIEARRKPKRGVTVQAHVRGAVAYRVLYAPLGPWTSQPQPLARLDVRGAHDAALVSGTVPVSLAKGSHLFAAIELDEPILQCPVRLAARRMVLP